jgi:hypothetical protein
LYRVAQLLLLALLQTACGSSSSEGTADGGGSDAGWAAHTLATCSTSIVSGAPEFFARYFKCVTVSLATDGVKVATNDLPPHASNYYADTSPNYTPFDASRGAQYKANPNRLAAKNLTFTIPNAPVAKGVTVSAGLVDGVVGNSPFEYPLGAVGVALDSVALFNPLAAPGMDIETEKYTFDLYNAHPTGDSTYHYHTVSPGPLEVLKAIGAVTQTTPGQAELELFGIMCDGTVLLGCTELDRTAPAGSLDAQGGHLHDLKDAANVLLFANRYHVHICPSSATGRKYTPEIQYYSSCTKTQ